MDTVKERVRKSIDNIENIVTKLKDMKLGKYFFQTAVLFRETMFLGSLLHSTEILFNITRTEMNLLQAQDNDLLRKILNTGLSTPKPILHLDMGILPVKFYIQMKRMLYYKHII